MSGNRAQRLAMLLGVVALLASGCATPTEPTSNPRPLPMPPGPPKATVLELTAAPNPAKAGDVIRITAVLAMQDSSQVGLYWNSSFGVFGGPPEAIPAGEITPREGGPVMPGTPITFLYQTTTPVESVFSVFPSKERVQRGMVPQDGIVKTVFLHVQ
jgi:hypothetical protein